VGPTNLSNGTLLVQSGDLNIGTGALTPALVTVTQDTTLQVNAGSLNVSANSTITATGKSLTLLADTITIASSADSIVADEVTLAPVTAGTNIFLGTATGSGLVLSQTAFDAIDANLIQIGQAGNIGDVTMGVLTLAGTTLLVVTDGPGGTVIVDGLFTSTGSTTSGIGLEITGSGATTLLNADIVSATDVIINDAIEVGAALVTIDTSSGNAAFGQNGGMAGIFATSGETNSLTINAGTGVVTLDSTPAFGDNGGAGSLVNNVTITAGNTILGAGTSEIAGIFSLPAGTLALLGNLTAAEIAVTSTAGVTLAGNVVLTAPTGIMLAGPVDDFTVGAFALTANSAGTTTFGGAIGGTTPLASVTTDAAGTTLLAGGSVTTTGAQTFNENMTLGANTTLTGSTITTAGTVTGGGNSLGVTGNAVIGGAVSGLSSLSVSGTTAVNTASITTTGSQIYGGLVTLGASTVTLTGTDPTFTAGVVGAGNSLMLQFSGTTAIDGATFTGINKLTSRSGGTTTLTGTLTTTGSQRYGDVVSLLGATTLAGDGITFDASVDGTQALVINDAGTTFFGDFVGDSTPLASLAVTAAGGIEIAGGVITTQGTQAYNDAVTLTSNTVLTGTTVTTNSTVAGGGNSLTVTGNAVVNGAISDVTNYAVSGTSTLAANVSSSGTQTFTGAVTLTQDVTLASSGSGAITFSGTVDGAKSLVVDTAGTTTFGGVVGGTTALTSIVTDAAGTVAINGGAVTTTGTQTYNENMTLGANTTLTGSTITTAGTVTGGGNSLGVTGNAVIGGAVSGVADLEVTGTTAVNTGSITTAGSQTYGGLVTLGAPTVTLTGTDGTFTGGVAGGGNSLVLTFSGTTALSTGTVNGIQNLTSNGGGTTTLTGTIETTGTQTYADAVTLVGDTTTKGTTVTFAAVTGGGRDLTVTGAAVFGGAVSGVDALTVSGTTAVNVATIATTGPQTYGGLVTLGAPTVTLSGTTPSFGGGVNGQNNSLSLAFSGLTAINGSAFASINHLLVQNTGSTSLTGALVTGGSQTYRNAVALAGATALEGTRIDFESTLDGARNLAVSATGGPVTFGAAVGGITPLGSLAIARATSVTAAGRVVLNGAATGADRTGLTIGAGVNNVTMTQTGNSVSGFAGNGVVLQGGSRASTFANFSISGNGESGFLMQAGDTAGTVIRDSAISRNGFNGVWLNGATPSVTVTGNILTSNNNNGIVVSGPASGVVISNNTISKSGLTGIRTEVVANRAPSNMTISGNSTRLNRENGMIIAGNTGTTVSGNVVADNQRQGIAIVQGATQTAVSGNQIYNNGAVGVVVSGVTTLNNQILSNSIYGNRSGGIALLDGANRNQASPVLKSAKLGKGKVTIAGTMVGRRGDVIRIQFFSNLPREATSSSQVQGRTLIAFRDITLTGTSTAFSVSVSATGIATDSWISATATRLVNGSPTNTSQFSGVRASTNHDCLESPRRFQA
jgi:hypothetical protein